MKRRRAIAAVLCTLIVTSAVLGGCGNSGGGSADPAIGPAEDKVDADGKVNGVFYETGVPIVDEGTYEFSIFCDDSSENGEWWMVDEMERQTKIKANIEYYPNEVAKEKLSLALSSGDYTDVIGGWLLSDSDILKYGVDQKLFIPLEDYFEKYAPNIMKILEREGVREAMTAPDGHIYTIPYVTDAPLVDFEPFINVKWLENVNMEMPTTTEEFKAVLKAFKEQDANGNGDPNDEIPLSFDPNNKHIGYMAGYFGVSVDNYGMTMKDGKLTFAANTEEYKEGIKFLRDLYVEGLIDPEAFTQDLSQWKAKGGQDRYGVSMMYQSNDIIPYLAGEKPNFEPLPVLKSENCDTPVWQRNSNGSSTLKTQVAITDKAKDVGAIIRWFDTLFSFENSAQKLEGPLDVCIFKEGDGFRKIDKATLSPEDEKKYSWANLFPQSLPHYLPYKFKFTEDVPMYLEKDIADAAYEPFLNEKIPDYWVALEDSATLAETQISIKDYLAQKQAEWIAGQADIDADWDEYLKQLDALGLQKYIELREKALSATTTETTTTETTTEAAK